MTVALDTDVLVNWAMEGTAFHRAARHFVERRLREGERVALTPSVLNEFVHVTTDPRRFPSPFGIKEAVARAREIWAAPEVVRIHPAPEVVFRTFELLNSLSLGQKRILDTALAATLELAGVRRLATFNKKNFQVFPFLELVSPRR